MKQNKYLSDYLDKFGDVGRMPRQVLLNELDNVWLDFKLDNSKSLNEQMQSIIGFYSHPVWILNGIFSEHDLISRNHRNAIANYIKGLNVLRVADYGGGSAVLARIIAGASSTQVDIVEPYMSQFFLEKLTEFNTINVVPNLIPEYDVVIAQDVLEHVDDPVGLAVELIAATKINGHLIFANSFYPDIKCHLPSNFYLRHTFIPLMANAGLKFAGRIDGAEHALIFRRVGDVDLRKLNKAHSKAKRFGFFLNFIHDAAGSFKRIIRQAA